MDQSKNSSEQTHYDAKGFSRLQVELAKIGVGNIVRQARNAAGLSQNKLADAADLNLRSVQRLEKGQTNPELASLVRLASVLKKPLRDLIPTQDRMKAPDWLTDHKVATEGVW